MRKNAKLLAAISGIGISLGVAIPAYAISFTSMVIAQGDPIRAGDQDSRRVKLNAYGTGNVDLAWFNGWTGNSYYTAVQGGTITVASDVIYDSASGADTYTHAIMGIGRYNGAVTVGTNNNKTVTEWRYAGAGYGSWVSSIAAPSSSSTGMYQNGGPSGGYDVNPTNGLGGFIYKDPNSQVVYTRETSQGVWTTSVIDSGPNSNGYAKYSAIKYGPTGTANIAYKTDDGFGADTELRAGPFGATSVVDGAYGYQHEAIDVASDGTLYLLDDRTSGNTQLWKSTNAGATWAVTGSIISAGITGDTLDYALAVSPSQDRIAALVYDDQENLNLAVSTDQGVNWSLQPLAGAKGQVADVGFSPEGTLYVAYVQNETVPNSSNDDKVILLSEVIASSPQWNLNGSGDWNVAGNWSGSIPNAVGAVAKFGSVITSKQTVYSNSPVTVGALQFDNANSYNIAGFGPLTIQVSSGVGSIDVAQGSHRINLPLVFASDTAVTVASGATLTIGNPVTIKANKTVTRTGNVLIQAPLTIETGGALNLGAGPAAVLFGAPSLATGAKVNLNNHAAVFEYGGQSNPIATIQSQIASAYANGAWTGSGITSTDAATVAATPGSHKTGIGFADNSALGLTSFGGQPVSSTSILSRYTYLGDANVDGTVNSQDFNALVAGYGDAATTWRTGDFNYDGKTDTRDFNFLAGNFNLTMPLASASLGSVVPEPSSLGLLLAAGLMGLRRRK